jgi:hypothetical protein
LTTYYNTFNGRSRESSTALGYPWVVQEEIVEYELADRTADAILADVGDDPVAAQEALDHEQRRETPRKVLSANLQRIIDAG